MSIDFQRLEQVLADAAARSDPAERAAFLAQACGDDRELRAEAERLLAAHEQAGSFLEEPVKPPPRSPRGNGYGETAALPDPGAAIERAGAIIGRYKLLEQIGEGGFGVVYMAEQVEPVQRKVALKIIKAGMDTRRVVARFEAEQQALALMDHASIARVFDGGVTPTGRPYFVMELVRGIPITDFCDQRNVAMPERLKLFMQVCHAVQHAHQKGIIHRDLKPSNILVTLIDGEPLPKVIDFGVAKALGQKLTEKTLFTGFAQMIGTPAYMSPEQADLSGVDVDTRADVYALGVLLYELLTGVTPFEAETFRRAALDEIRRMIRETEPPKPSTRLHTLGVRLAEVAKHRDIEPAALRKLVRGDLDWIVMKALEKDRGRRYDTANSLADDIERHLAHEPVLACPPGTMYRLRKFVRRNRIAVAFAASVTVTLIIGLALAMVGFAQARRERDRALDAEQQIKWERDRALSAETLAESEQARAEESLYRASIVAAQQSMESGRYDSARRFLDEAPANHCGFEWGCLQYLCNLDRFTLHGHSDAVNALSCSPDGRFLASVSSDKTARIWDLRTGTLVLVLAGHEEVLNAVAYSPDGRFLATGSGTTQPRTSRDTTVRIWDVGSGREVARMNTNSSPVLSLAYSPDGSLIAAGTRDGRAQVWDAGTHKLRFTLEPRGLIKIAFSPDGARLVTSGSSVIKLWDVRSGAFLFSPGSQRDGVTSICFSPDGSVVASVGPAGFCAIWDLASRRLVHEIDVGSKWPGSVAFSPDGAYLAVGCRDRTVRVFLTDSGSEVRCFKGHGGSVYAVLFGRDGKTVISAGQDGVIKLWPWAYDLEATKLIGHDGIVMSVVFDPRGSRVTTGSYGGTAKLWDRLTGRELRTLAGPFERVEDVAFSPTGDRLALACSDGTARIWDGDGVAEQIRIAGHSAAVNSVAFYPDGATLLTSSSDGAAEAWDLASGRMRASFRGHEAAVCCAAVSPDGNWVATASSDETARIWSATTGSLTHVLRGHVRVVYWAAFSPDSRRVATSSADNTGRVWDVASGKLIMVLKGHTSDVQQAEFSPDGQRLATVSIDGSAKIWDSRNGQELLTLRARTEPGGREPCLHCLAFSPDGTCLATGGGEADPVSVYLWPTLPRTRDDSVAASGGDVMEAIKRQHWESVLRARSTPRPLPERVKPTTAAVRPPVIKVNNQPAPVHPSSLVDLGKQSPEGVARAVELALSMEPPVAAAELLVYGEYLLLGGRTAEAITAIRSAITAGGSQHWYYKSLGWALRSEGQTEAAEAAFESVLAGLEDWSSPPSTADSDHWTAAYFLDLVTQEQYAERWRNDARFKEKFACFPWFYIGQRMEIEGQRDEASNAYRKSVELGELPDAHPIHHWSAYRLHVLTGEPPSTPAGAANSQPAKQPATSPSD